MPRIERHTLTKREILYGEDLTPHQLEELAKAYREAGYPGDAAHFLAETGLPGALADLKRWAIEQGDAWMLISVARADTDAVQDDDWRKLAEKARRLGKESYARRAEHILAGGELMGPMPHEEQDQPEEEAPDESAQ
jgi:hypothetical protein